MLAWTNYDSKCIIGYVMRHVIRNRFHISGSESWRSPNRNRRPNSDASVIGAMLAAATGLVVTNASQITELRESVSLINAGVRQSVTVIGEAGFDPAFLVVKAAAAASDTEVFDRDVVLRLPDVFGPSVSTETGIPPEGVETCVRVSSVSPGGCDMILRAQS